MSVQILDRDQIARLAPAALATSASPKVSERYQFVSTMDIIDKMQGEGFMPIRARQNSRLGDPAFGRHEIVFRQASALERPTIVGEAIPEIRLVNAHDRSATYELSAGLYRLICGNGMTVVDPKTEMFLRGRHTGEDAIGEIIEGTYRIIKEFPVIADNIKSWQHLSLTDAQQIEFGRAAALLRWEDPSDDLVDALLNARRREDEGADLWRVMNRIQENVVRGGLKYKTNSGNAAATRGLESIVSDLDFNGRLWSLTEAAPEYFS